MQTYTQQAKQDSREKLIRHAIRSLTKDRKDSYMVTEQHLQDITDHFKSLLFEMLGGRDPEFANTYNSGLFDARNRWMEFYRDMCKAKSAGELKVLYLCGPEPVNDLELLCNNGIRMENIWAIEGDRKNYLKAVESLMAANYHIKIHRGSLSEFFELTNHEFDIIYFDACSPILSARFSPLETLKQIFVNKRLTGLSALITNFAEPKNDMDWAASLATWFATKEYDEVPAVDENYGPPPVERIANLKHYQKYIQEHLPQYYDSFLTHFIPTMAAEIVPMWQFTALSSVRSNHFLNEQILPEVLKNIKSPEIRINKASDLFAQTPHYALAVDAYPLLNWARLVQENLPKPHPLYQFVASNRKKMTIEDALYLCSLLKRFEEADTGFRTFIFDICGSSLRRTLEKIDFFDRELRLTCDIPMKNLFVELLIGLYGYPYIAHSGKNLSLAYRAKETTMYANVFVFDQCRYLYDFLPSIDLWEDFFANLPNQTIVRGCIDGIRRNHLYLNSSLFKWGFLEDTDSFGVADLAERFEILS